MIAVRYSAACVLAEEGRNFVNEEVFESGLRTRKERVRSKVRLIGSISILGKDSVDLDAGKSKF